MNANRSSLRCRRGFTLVELTVVVVIIGVLAAFGIPRMLRSVERSKATEAFSYLAAVRESQERFQAFHGTYANALSSLDVEQSFPKYFQINHFHAGDTGSFEDSWELRLERKGSSAGYGKYRVSFNQDGYDPDLSSIESLPEINPGNL